MIHIQYQTEEKVILSDGKTFIPTPQMGCDGCAFDCEELDHVCNDGRLLCAAMERDDCRSVIWVEKIPVVSIPDSVEQSKRHPHADLIIAWANGAKIQKFYKDFQEWMDEDDPYWSVKHKYRIKPQPKPDTIGYVWIGKNSMLLTNNATDQSNVKCTFDGETGELKSVEMVKKND